MKCPKCGNEISANVGFCKYCKKSVVNDSIRLKNEKNERNNKQIFELPLSQADTVADVTQSINVDMSSGENNKTNKKVKAVVAVATSVIALLMGVVVFITLNANGKKPDNTEIPDAVQITQDESETSEAINSNIKSVVTKINAESEQILNGALNDKFEASGGNGLSVYSDGDELRLIVVEKDHDGNNYARKYYYDKDGLFMACYDDMDSNRFYFENGKMVIWRYAFDINEPDDAVNYDRNTNSDFDNWEKCVKEDAALLKAEWRKLIEPEQEFPNVDPSNISHADASTFLSEPEYSVVHVPNRVIDGDIKTGWVEGAAGQGIGECITVHFDGMYTVSGIEIYAGYHKNDYLYAINSRPKEVYFDFFDGSGETHVLADVKDMQNIRFNKPVVTNRITLYIYSVYPGSKFEDTVISEICPY